METLYLRSRAPYFYPDRRPWLTVILVKENAHPLDVPPPMQRMDGSWQNRFGSLLTRAAPVTSRALLEHDARPYDYSRVGRRHHEHRKT